MQGPIRQPLSPQAAGMLASARQAWSQRQFDVAERLIMQVLALAPDEADAIRMLGTAAQRRGDHARASDCFRRVLPVWPEDSDLRIGLGIALYERGEIDEAMAQLRRACELAPTSGSAWFNLGEALWRQTHTEESIVALQRALEIVPAYIPAMLSLARAQASLGQIDAAVAGFRSMLKVDPGNAEGWFGLSNLNTVRFDATDEASLRRALARTNMPDRDRELLSFTLAKALEDQRDYAQAFEMFRTANTSRRKRVKWDAAGEHRRVEAIERIFTNDMTVPLDPEHGR